ncbi:hypothetical protein ZYGR_0AD05580 [Zygosaccharomyces rouxii]|uniref:Uncharacterized protein n=1 Tax=Zygosaccharomyces rouxii TaxID=4956 RepID=A0A1Q3A6L6_ZYGRO|nr:hypothetical protein ZYGR_0AD05580 [Zygosaccharomyces rouxii]
MLLLWPLLLLINIVLADVSVISPKKGDTFSPSGGKVSIDVQWEDNGAPPEMNQIVYYSITLNNGPNEKINNVGYLKNKMNPSDVQESNGTYSVTVEIDAAKYGDGQYFLQVYAAITEDASENTINYSPRFNLKNMLGSPVSYSDSTQPPDAAQYTTYVAYTKQTGVTRTAPMQTQPGSTVTATSWSMKFPTSAVSYFPTLSPTPHWKTTLTPGWNYTMTSAWNYATPRPLPSENGGWYNPKKRQSLSTRKMNLKSLLSQSISK